MTFITYRSTMMETLNEISTKYTIAGRNVITYRMITGFFFFRFRIRLTT